MDEDFETSPATSTTKWLRRGLMEALAWMGIAASAVFIINLIFFSGYFFSRTSGGYPFEHRMGPGSIYSDCIWTGHRMRCDDWVSGARGDI
jgi:hypothetical protein